jgi:uncharacterized protein YggU (UPF0235/DUF167 family)
MGRIKIRVFPRARQTSVEQDGEVLRVHVSAAPADGMANEAAIRAVAAHFGIPKSKLKIIRGETSRDKIIDVP